MACHAATLYPFRYRDPLTGKWVRARYKAEAHVIAERFAEWEITGPAELRLANSVGFNPYRQPIPHAELMRLEEPAPEINPHLEQPPTIDRIERFLLAVFLRRYVTYYARRRRFAQMEGAARMHRKIGAIEGQPFRKVVRTIHRRRRQIDPKCLHRAHATRKAKSRARCPG